MEPEEPTRIKADIVPYSAEYSSLVRSWIESPETYKNVCRGQEFPPPEDIVDSWQRQGVSSFTLFSQRRPVAYGELWPRPLEMAVEIAHLLVDPYKRSQGYGSKMLELLYQRAAQRRGVAKVVLNLYGDDEVALGCYLKAGFELVGTSSYTVGLRMVRMVR
jgi:ribosomal protein S18 acetylase RimI-like enzyme